MIGGWDAKFSGGPHDGEVIPLRGFDPPDFLHAVTTAVSTEKSRLPRPWEPAADCIHPADRIGIYLRVGRIPSVRVAGYLWVPPDRHVGQPRRGDWRPR